VKGALVAVANSPAALRDDCDAAAILVLRFARPRGCSPSAVAIDVETVRRGGAHALYVEARGVRVETVADNRGDRPWAPRLSADDGSRTADMADEDWPARGRRTR
jgi:competence protein ComEC